MPHVLCLPYTHTHMSCVCRDRRGAAGGVLHVLWGRDGDAAAHDTLSTRGGDLLPCARMVRGWSVHGVHVG